MLKNNEKTSSIIKETPWVGLTRGVAAARADKELVYTSSALKEAVHGLLTGEVGTIVPTYLLVEYHRQVWGPLEALIRHLRREDGSYGK